MGTRTLELPEEVVAAAEAVAKASNRSVIDVIRAGVQSIHRLVTAPLSEPRPTVRIVPPLDRSEEMEWTQRNAVKYAGKWVALSGENLIAHGDDGLEVYLTAKSAGVHSPMLVHMPEAEELAWGGL